MPNSVIKTSGKFIPCVNEIGSNLPLVTMTGSQISLSSENLPAAVANLPPVSMTAAVNLTSVANNVNNISLISP
jgi:hypothetical protein